MRRILQVPGVALLAAIFLTVLTPSLAAAATVPEVRITTLSSRADMVTGGNALIRVDVPPAVAMNAIAIKVNGQNMTSTFRADMAARTYTGLVSGLNVGLNNVAVYTNATGIGRPAEQLTVTNYPIEGPVFSGPHEQPFICATQNFNLPAGLGNLGPPVDPTICSINTRVDYIYRRTNNTYAPLPAGATSYPADMVTTTTTQGKTVPFIVRIETGTVNRAIYQTTVLHDPIAQPAPTWDAPPPNWNGRLVYTFGGGCIGGWYRQGSSTGGVTDDFRLANGYAMASSSLNVYGNNCQDITAAESMMMVKERFVEAYGPPAHTQGWGCSGGSYAQHQITDNYPGLLDGIIPCRSFQIGRASCR